MKAPSRFGRRVVRASASAGRRAAEPALQLGCARDLRPCGQGYFFVFPLRSWRADDAPLLRRRGVCLNLGNAADPRRWRYRGCFGLSKRAGISSPNHAGRGHRTITGPSCKTWIDSFPFFYPFPLRSSARFSLFDGSESFLGAALFIHGPFRALVGLPPVSPHGHARPVAAVYNRLLIHDAPFYSDG